MHGFRDLLAYQRAFDLANDIHLAVERWNPFAKWTVGTQLVRAADSVGANIAEAAGRRSLPDERRLLLVARGSAYELQHWLASAECRGLLSGDFTLRAAEVGRLVNGLVRHRSNALMPNA